MNEVYLITNTVNNKQYVGVTYRGYEARFREHINDALNNSKTMLHNAIRKYGQQCFMIELLESNIPDSLIDKKEMYYISKYKTFYADGGYNMTLGGGGMAGYKHTKEAIHKISASLKGHIYPKSRNHKIKLAMIGREYKQEWKDALSLSRLGRFKGEDNPFYGKHHSNKTKELISKANTKCPIIQIDPHTAKVVNEFANRNEAGRWIVANGISNANYDTCACRISEVIKNKNKQCTAYGFHWREKEGQSTNL